MSAIFWLTVRQLTGRWRLVVTGGLAAIAVALTITMSALASNDLSFERDFISGVIDGLLISGIMPLIVMVLATSAFGVELEDKTLSYLVLKPVSKWKIAAPKFAASLAVGGPIVLASGVVSTVVAFGGAGQPVVAVAAATIAGTVAYAAVFTWAGLVTTRPLYYALAYVLIWEAALTNLFSGIRYLSIRAYTLSILRGADEARFRTEIEASRVLDTPDAVIGVAIVTVVFLALTVRRLRRMDVP